MSYAPVILRPATVHEALALFPAVRRRLAGGVVWQVLASTLVAFEADGAVVAVAGLHEHPHAVDGLDHLFELWFACRPAAGAVVGRGLRTFRLTLARAGQDRHCRVFVLVRSGDRDGQRLARGLGMNLAGVADGLETWSVEHGAVPG